MLIEKVRELSDHGFRVDLCKDRNWGPPKVEVRCSLDLWNRVCVRFDVEESCWDMGSEEGVVMELKAFKEDWWQPKGGKVRFDEKGKKPICVGIWSCSSNKLWWPIVCEVVDITSSWSFSPSFYIDIPDVSKTFAQPSISSFSLKGENYTLMECRNL